MKHKDVVGHFLLPNSMWPLGFCDTILSWCSSNHSGYSFSVSTDSFPEPSVNAGVLGILYVLHILLR